MYNTNAADINARVRGPDQHSRASLRRIRNPLPATFTRAEGPWRFSVLPSARGDFPAAAGETTEVYGYLQGNERSIFLTFLYAEKKEFCVYIFAQAAVVVDELCNISRGDHSMLGYFETSACPSWIYLFSRVRVHGK